jgi:hypothetical protein
MSDNENATLLYTCTAEYREAIGVVRFVTEWVDDTYDNLNTFPTAKLRVRLADVNSFHLKFTDACSRLLGSLDPAIDEQEYSSLRRKMRTVRNQLDDLKVKADELFLALPGPSATSTPSKPPRDSHSSSPTSKLPYLPIPRFDGLPESWISFLDQFDSVVDNQPDLTPTLKLHYLAGALSDEPRRLIQHLKIEGGNYPVARDLLKRRYHNLRLLADTHLAQILSLPSIDSKLGGLRVSILNPLLTSYRCLERLELPVAYWSYLLVHVCLTKLPTDLKSRFERRYGDNPNSLPTFDALIAFLEDECRHYDNVGSAIVDSPPPTSHVTRPAPPKPKVRSPPPPPRFYLTTTPPPRSKCFMCDNTQHYLRECPTFRRLSIRERISFVRDARLCYRCLDKHSLSSCRRNYRCYNCDSSSHHTMLCYSGIPLSRERTVSFRDVVVDKHSSPPRSTAPRSPPRSGGRYSPPTTGKRYSPPPSGGRSSSPGPRTTRHYYVDSRSVPHPASPVPRDRYLNSPPSRDNLRPVDRSRPNYSLRTH